MSRLAFVLGAALSFAPVATRAAAPETVPHMAVASDNGHFPIREFSISGNLAIATERILQALNGCLGESQTAAALLQAHDAVYRVYQEAGYEMVYVELPSEIGTDGIVRIHVREMTVGAVTVNGNEHYTSDYFRAVLPSLQENRSPNLSRIARELFLANDHSGYQMALNFTPEANGNANVEIKVKDVSPVRAALSADNTGTESTGRSRTTITASHANLGGVGHVGTVGYTTSPEFPGKVHQLILSYQLSLPSLGSQLQLGYSYSNTDVGRVADVANISGQGTTYSLRLQHDLRRSSTTRHLVELGLDDKRYKNTYDFFGFNYGVDVNARPFSVNYVFTDRTGVTGINAGIGYVRNIPGGAGNDDVTYNDSRQGAKASWSVWRANAEFTSAMPSDWTLHCAFDAQYTAEPLISAEQFGLGGARSVRGFQERESSGDRGWRLSNEVLAPRIAGQHRLLTFVDAGRDYRLNALPGEPTGASLLSYGIGWRWTHRGAIYTALDWARVVRGTLTTPKASDAIHFSANWRFI
jgi:hemolysin activation/secretion protein